MSISVFHDCCSGCSSWKARCSRNQPMGRQPWLESPVPFGGLSFSLLSEASSIVAAEPAAVLSPPLDFPATRHALKRESPAFLSLFSASNNPAVIRRHLTPICPSPLHLRGQASPPAQAADRVSLNIRLSTFLCRNFRKGLGFQLDYGAAASFLFVFFFLKLSGVPFHASG